MFLFETFSACRLWIRADAIVGASMRKPIPVLVANHPRLRCTPLFKSLSNRSDIEMEGVEASEEAIPGVLRTQNDLIYGLI
jgi:hypothetical protein